MSKREDTIHFIDAFVRLFPEAEFGPAHILLSDYNMSNRHLTFVTERIGAAMGTAIPPNYLELQATLCFIQMLSLLPDEWRH